MGHDLHPHLVWGEPTFTVTQQWDRARDESLYGLGQHQHDLIDISDVDLGLYQHNTEIFIPFLVSSRGYGILWDNTSFTRYGELADAVPLPNTAGLYSTSPDAEAGRRGDAGARPDHRLDRHVRRAGQRDVSVRDLLGGRRSSSPSATARSSITGGSAGCPARISRACRSRPDSRCRCTCTGSWTAPRASSACSGGRRSTIAASRSRPRSATASTTRSSTGRTAIWIASSPATASSPARRRCCRARRSASGSRASAIARRTRAWTW